MTKARIGLKLKRKLGLREKISYLNVIIELNIKIMEFEEFVESLESLPIDLSRNIRLLRQLDDKNLQLRQECIHVSDKFKQEIDSIQKREHIKILNDIQIRRLQLADEKVVLAEQASELCEKHI
ncbi:unnamed protein product [Didymodactylos carnosus]|uniref:Inhibitor of growth protein N-terminal histone-binding domain-containing protein n=1 Tax=Didymodactylos carnosus TaxID=1234261 RepID=A0A814MXM9_9BILA|nr:unnamed protein product [Didymodactylos carnosus]CAF3848450.1 unnamed protein product [Didymodactylos carnosus]